MRQVKGATGTEDGDSCALEGFVLRAKGSPPDPSGPGSLWSICLCNMGRSVTGGAWLRPPHPPLTLWQHRPGKSAGCRGCPWRGSGLVTQRRRGWRAQVGTALTACPAASRDDPRPRRHQTQSLTVLQSEGRPPHAELSGRTRWMMETAWAFPWGVSHPTPAYPQRGPGDGQKPGDPSSALTPHPGCRGRHRPPHTRKVKHAGLCDVKDFTTNRY